MHLVVGCGLSGSVIAERIASVRQEEVLVVERREHIGGNIYDYKNSDGIFIHEYGPHAFHTSDKIVWDYLSAFTRWTIYWHMVDALIDGINVPLPFNFNTMAKLFPASYAERCIEELVANFGLSRRVTLSELMRMGRFAALAAYVYEKVYKGYTIKQWGLIPEELDENVFGRVPLVMSRDDRYFQDIYQAIPSKGYTEMIRNMVSTPGIEVELNRDLKAVDKQHFDTVIYTGKIDEYFDYSLGPLPYRSLRFELETVDREYFQATAQRNYPNNFDFTRTTEFKHFLNDKSPRTTIAYEFPLPHFPGENEPYYPVPRPENHALYRQYAGLAAKERKTAFVGRLAEYRYYNMDQAVQSALSAFSRLNEEGFFGEPKKHE